LRLKIETLLEETTSDGRLFHASMMRLSKKCL